MMEINTTLSFCHARFAVAILTYYQKGIAAQRSALLLLSVKHAVLSEPMLHLYTDLIFYMRRLLKTGINVLKLYNKEFAGFVPRNAVKRI